MIEGFRNERHQNEVSISNSLLCDCDKPGVDDRYEQQNVSSDFGDIYRKQKAERVAAFVRSLDSRVALSDDVFPSFSLLRISLPLPFHL